MNIKYNCNDIGITQAVQKSLMDQGVAKFTTIKRDNVLWSVTVPNITNNQHEVVKQFAFGVEWEVLT